MSANIAKANSAAQTDKQSRTLSFSQALYTMYTVDVELRKKGRHLPTFLLDSKILAHEFAHTMGLNVPTIYGLGIPLEEVEFKPGTVVKPLRESSARGVFVTEYDGTIRYLNKNRIYTSPEDAKKYAKGLLDKKLIRRDSWLCEELLSTSSNIARDIKFYMFYGEVGLVLETQRSPRIRRCWYDSDGNHVKTGKYDKILFSGDGNYAEVEELAKKISLSIPAPFARVDFLVNNGKIYFGEVTPMPSRYKTLNEQWDVELGEKFVAASMRLNNDLAYGKLFSEFNEMEKNSGKVAKKINKQARELQQLSAQEMI